MDDIRRALHRWMQDVLRQRGWSAAAWARQAGVTPSSLTRFLHDPERGSVPGGETLGRLAQAAGSEPRFLSAPASAPVGRVPLLSVGELADRGAAPPREVPFLPVDLPVSPMAFAVTLDSDFLLAAGLHPGDRIVVEPPDIQPPRPGDVVVTLDLVARRVCAYRFHPPWLLPTTADPACVPVRFNEADVLGVGIMAVRALRALRADKTTDRLVPLEAEPV